MSDSSETSSPLRIVVIRDSADARLLVELSSYGSDLAEAGSALDLAARADDPESTLMDAQPFLLGFAVVAYYRGVTASKVRPGLTEHVRIPSDLTDTHELIKAFRNRTVAHSQSDLAVTYPIGVLDSNLEVRAVLAPTVLTSLPRSVMLEFRRLIEAMQELLDDVTAPVRARLAEQLRSIDTEDLLNFPGPSVIERFAEDFDPRTTRASYPTSHTLYWTRVDEDDSPTTS